MQNEDVERFIDGWQVSYWRSCQTRIMLTRSSVLIFRRYFCLSLVCVFMFFSTVLSLTHLFTDNVIREALKQRLVALPVQETSFLPEGHPSGRSRKSDTILRLHMKANAKCHAVVRLVVTILRRNLGSPFFQYDAALVRDGCFFAGFLLAGENGTRDDVEICLAALSEMRWAFSKNDERQRTVRLVWDARASQSRGQSSRSFSSSPSDDTLRGPGSFEGSYVRRPLIRPTSVPPLSLSATTMGYDSSSAPNTACTPDGRWPSAASGSGSESERYQPSSRSPSIPSTSSSYVQSSHSALSLSNVLQGESGAVGPSPLLLASSRVPAGGPGGQSAYYVPSYNYLSMSESVEPRPAAAQSGSLETLSQTEQAPAFSHPTAAFDYTGVSYSSSSLGQAEAGSSYLPAPGPSTSQGGSPPFGGHSYY